MSKRSDEAIERRSDEGENHRALHFPSSLRRLSTWSWSLFFVVLLLFSGCDYGVGGTGELVIPREKLHEIDHITLTPAPATQATTEPTTLPTTAPAESIDLTIEQARRDALANNLDLHVQLFDPTIAGESLKAER